MTFRELMGPEAPEFEIIDMHAHMNRPGQFLCPGEPDADGMIAAMDRVGIHRIAVAPNMAINCDAVLGNQMVLEAAGRFPDRIMGMATVNFHYFEESMDSLEYCLSTPWFRGIKLHPDFMSYSVRDAEKMHAVLDAARRHGAFLLSHTDARHNPGHLTLYSDPAWFEPYIRAYPDVNFILAHCGLTSGGYQTCLRLAGDYGNVYLDTTGFRFSQTWTVDGCARAIGTDKIVFGTDMPFNDVGSAAGRVLLSELPLEQRVRMMGANARRLLKEA